MTLPRQHLLQHSNLLLHARFTLHGNISPSTQLTKEKIQGIGKEALTVPPVAVLISTLFS